MIHCGAPCRENLKEEDRKSSRDLPSPGASCAISSILGCGWIPTFVNLTGSSCLSSHEAHPHQWPLLYWAPVSWLTGSSTHVQGHGVKRNLFTTYSLVTRGRPTSITIISLELWFWTLGCWTFTATILPSCSAALWT